MREDWSSDSSRSGVEDEDAAADIELIGWAKDGEGAEAEEDEEDEAGGTAGLEAAVGSSGPLAFSRVAGAGDGVPAFFVDSKGCERYAIDPEASVLGLSKMRTKLSSQRRELGANFEQNRTRNEYVLHVCTKLKF